VSHHIEKILFYFPEFLVEKRLENHYQDIGLPAEQEVDYGFEQGFAEESGAVEWDRFC
jgi:hypothetical protein